MDAFKRAWRRRRGRQSSSGISGSKVSREAARAAVQERLASVLEPWLASGKGAEVAARSAVARQITSAVLHEFRFDSESEEMAWMRCQLTEFGAMALDLMETPRKAWDAAHSRVALRALRGLGPNVELIGVASLSSLPSGLEWPGCLTIEWCDALVALPDGLRARRLIIDSCGALEALPDDVSITTKITVSACSSLTQVGRNLRAEQVNITGSSVVSVGEGIDVGSDMFLAWSRALVTLPDGLRCGGSLNLSGCTALEDFPRRATIGRTLMAKQCAFRTLPSDVQAGAIVLDGCERLESLPQLNVRGYVSLTHCTSLRAVAPGTRCGSDMYLDGCTSLESLPADLHVGRDLRLTGSTALTTLPNDERFFVGEDILLGGCTGIRALPDTLLAWEGRQRDIFLGGSGLPPEELARLQALDNPALRFHVSIQEFDLFGEDEDELETGDFATLDGAAGFWAKQAGVGEQLDVLLEPFVEGAYVRGVLLFLSKLRRAKEFAGNVEMREGLASRVVEVLVLITGEDNGVREELLVRMTDSVDACGDKPVWALNQMSITVQVCKARGDRAKLRALAMGVMRLEVVHRHVRKAMDAMNFVDDVCVYLRFEIALRESLQLPVSALEMLYPSYITVTQESIAAAEAEALRLTEEDLDAWLPAWSEWQRQERVEFAEELDFAALKRNSTKRLSLSLRGLLGNKVADPVRVRPAKAVWSLADLMKHWINTGMDLNNTPRNVDYMRLNLTKCI